MLATTRVELIDTPQFNDAAHHDVARVVGPGDEDVRQAPLSTYRVDRYDLSHMDPATETALRLLDRVEQDVRAEGPVVVSEDYLRAIRLLEALPENQDGADKSWMWATYEFCRRHFAQFERI